MSKLLNPAKLTEKQQILQNVNAFVSIHDLSCKCNNPLKCIILQIYHQEKGLQFKQEEIQQWLTTTDAGEITTGKEDNFDGEDLDALFADDAGTSAG